MKFLYKIIILIITIIIIFFGIFMINKYNSNNKTNRSTKEELYKVKKQDDTILEGIVKPKNIMKINYINKSDMIHHNGDYIKKGQQLSKSGYTSPISGQLNIKEKSFYIVSSNRYVSSNITEYDRPLIHRNMKIKTSNIEDPQKFSNEKITKIDVLPINYDSTITNYKFYTTIKNYNIGKHIYIYIPHKDVIVPKTFVKKSNVLVKKDKKWTYKHIKLTKNGEILYTSKRELPEGTEIRRVS